MSFRAESRNLGRRGGKDRLTGRREPIVTGATTAVRRSGQGRGGWEPSALDPSAEPVLSLSKGSR
jgi:hypothetical protein